MIWLTFSEGVRRWVIATTARPDRLSGGPELAGRTVIRSGPSAQTHPRQRDNETTRQGFIDITTTPQRRVHVSARTAPRRTARGPCSPRGTAPGPQPVAAGPEARGFVLHVGMDESAAAAAGTSLTRLARRLRRYVESVVPGSQAAAAVAIAPAGAPGSDLEVVRRALGGPSTRPGVGPAPVSSRPIGLVIDRGRREVRLDGEALHLGNKEFELLGYLVEHGGRTVPRRELVDALWANTEEVPNERMIDSHVRRLRAKLGRLATTVCTVRGQGYRFAEHPEVVVWPALEYSI